MSSAMQMARGFTLLELLITIAVASLLLGFGVPAMRNAAEKREAISAAEEVYSYLQYARSESVARASQVFANLVGGGTWALGIGADPACDPADNVPACSLPDVDGANEITYRVTAADFDNITVTTTSNQITFSPQRATATPATITVTSTGNAGYVMEIQVGVLGQISMCSPSAAPQEYVGSYRAC